MAKYISESLNKMLKAQALEALIDYVSEYGLDKENYNEFWDDGVEICAVLARKTAYNALELEDHVYDGYKLAVRVTYPEMEAYETPIIIVDGKDVVYEDLCRYDYECEDYEYNHNIYYKPKYIYYRALINDYYDFITVDSKDVAVYKPYIVERTAKADDDDYDLEELFEELEKCYGDDDDDDLPF